MRALQAGAVARLEAAWTADRVHDAGSVPASPAIPYCVVSVDTGLPGNYVLTADHGSRSVRVAVQCVGRTLNECLFAAEKADLAFQGASFAAEGWDIGPGRAEIAASPRRDADAGGLMYALATFTHTAVEED